MEGPERRVGRCRTITSVGRRDTMHHVTNATPATTATINTSTINTSTSATTSCEVPP